MKIKICTGFSQDEKFTIEDEEAHKAYYLFNNPEKRGTFSNGVALVGKNINSILPDWNETMGWNPSHRLDDDDWNDIRSKGIDNQMDKLLESAQRTAKLAETNPNLLEIPLSQAYKSLPRNENQNLLGEEIKKLTNKIKI